MSDPEIKSTSRNIQVVLRLRPMNKLETSRRSKNCIELHDDPRSLTVDSPLEGEYDFTFDHVLEEHATQQETYSHSVDSVAFSLLEGFNCTVMSYGATGTGKSLTLLGDSAHEGMILRIAQALFDAIEKTDDIHTEYTIKCSFVEIYLEKVLDLLLPGGRDEAVNIASSGDIVGAAELCCVDRDDIHNVLARGSAHRTQSSTELNTDSSRSHAVFALTLTQTRGSTQTTARLLVCDLAGSEFASPQRANDIMGAVQAEAKMVNKSLSELHGLVKIRLADASTAVGADKTLPESAKRCRLTRLLQGSFGGNTLTTIILTASPSSYNIGETISTVNFGQRCRKITNFPRVNQRATPLAMQRELAEKQEKLRGLLTLVKDLAKECRASNERIDGVESRDSRLWDNVQTLLEHEDENVEERLEVVVRPVQKDESTDMPCLQSDLEEQLAELRSEVSILRTQNEELTADKKRNSVELMNSKNEIHLLSQRKTEVEHNLRTSQFRENEAIVFLRQFRRFYRNVLRDKARHGSGSLRKITEEIGQKASNAPDLNQLTDVDALMLESGLIEDYELNDDKSGGTYGPSKEALVRSAAAAEKAAALSDGLRQGKSDNTEIIDDGSSYVTASSVRSSIRRIGTLNVSVEDGKESISDVGDGGVSRYVQDDKVEDAHSLDDASSIGERYGADGPDAGVSSLATGSESSRGQDGGSLVAARAKLLMTPAGRLTTMREKELEKELLGMSEHCIDLQMALKEEKATVEALTSRSGGLSKKKLAQEAIALRQQLEKMNENLMAIAWKMNELNLINKSYNEKMVNREQHVIYLEENLVELQNTNRKIVRERQEAEKRLREEVESLTTVVDGMTLPLWQFGDMEKAVKPTINRIIVSRGAGSNKLTSMLDRKHERRMSAGEIEPDLDIDSVNRTPEKESKEMTTQTERDEVTEKADIEMQTDPEESVATTEAEVQTDEAANGKASEEQVGETPGTCDIRSSPQIHSTDLSAVAASDSGASEDQFVPSSEDEQSLGSVSEEEKNRTRRGFGTALGTTAMTGGIVAEICGSDDKDGQIDPTNEPISDEAETGTATVGVSSIEEEVRGEESERENESAKKWAAGLGIAAGTAGVAAGVASSLQGREDGEDQNSVSSESDASIDHFEPKRRSLQRDLTPPRVSEVDYEFVENAHDMGHQDEETFVTVGAYDEGIDNISQSARGDRIPSQNDAEHDDDAADFEDDFVVKETSSNETDGVNPFHEEEDASSSNDFAERQASNDSFVEEKEAVAALEYEYEREEDITMLATDQEDVLDRPTKYMLTDDMLVGGKPTGFEPRRFVDKLGPSIRPGIMEENKKSARDHTRRANEEGERKSMVARDEKKHKKKKRKSSDPNKKKRKESKKKSSRDKSGHRDRDHSQKRSHRRHEFVQE